MTVPTPATRPSQRGPSPIMAKVRRSFTVDKPPGEVVAYLRDFSHAQDWDPGTIACTRLDPGELHEGSTWHNISQFLGRRTELTYRLQRDDPDRLTFVGTSHTATSTDDLTFAPDGTGTRITYRAHIRLHSVARLADPIVLIALQGIAGDVIARMREVINAL